LQGTNYTLHHEFPKGILWSDCCILGLQNMTTQPMVYRLYLG
jgi:hypothetical protein